MNFRDKITLGRTGLNVGRLGISSSYGAPAEAFEEAFEKGCNYFSWGTFIKGRSKEMKKAIINILQTNHRRQHDKRTENHTHRHWDCYPRHCAPASIPQGDLQHAGGDG